MYDPSVGRWLTEDPTGFAAGDANLYRYVGNDPTDATDPTGLVGILFDGSGYKAADGTILSRLLHPYVVGETDKNLNRDGNYLRTNVGNLGKKVDQAEMLILAALKTNPGEPVDIIGYSRGGIAALALVKRLEKKKITVRFLGLLDPTAPVKSLVEDKQFMDPNLRNVGSNVETAAIIVRDGKNDGALLKHQYYRTFFKTGKVTFSKGTKVLVDKSVPLNHLQVGFSKSVAKLLWDAAKQAGVNLPAYEKSPYQEEGYDDKPRGGTSFVQECELLIRKLKILDE